MPQWTVIRTAIAKDREMARSMTAGLHGERALDSADQLRLEQMLAENAWALFHVWERTQHGIFPKGTSKRRLDLCGPTCSERPRRNLVAQRKDSGFIPGFVADVDAIIAKDSRASAVV